MVSYSDALKMMQGGEDRTGYADMIDTLGEPGDLLAKKRAEAEQRRSLMAQIALANQSSNTGGDGSLIGDISGGDISGGDISGGDISGGDESNGFSFSGAFDKAKTFVDDYTDSFLTSKGEELKDKIIDKSGDFLKSIYDVADEPANIVGPNLSLNIAEALGLTQEPDPDKDPIVINVNDIMGQAGDYMGQAGDYLYNLNPDGADVVSGIFNAFGGMANEKIRNTLGPYINYFSDNPEYDYDINFADGGRVGMQQGGMPAPALLGVSSGSLGFGGGQQNMANFQDAMYRPPLNRPPMRGDPDFVSGPGFGMQPTPMPFPVGPFKPMPFQPSPMQTADFDFGDYLGGSDPFAADYDPYVNATGTGAYDQYGMGMTQEDIDKVFADTDKFSLAAQAAKKKAEEEEAAKREQRRRGEGRGDRDFARERHMRDVQRANRDTTDARGGGNRGGPGDSNAPGGSAAAGGNRGGAPGARS